MSASHHIEFNGGNREQPAIPVATALSFAAAVSAATAILAGRTAALGALLRSTVPGRREALLQEVRHVHWPGQPE